MCANCKDNIENKSTRRTLVILVLFSVTLSALGISCFALLTVQKLSKDLNALRIVLSRIRVDSARQPAYGFINNLNRDGLPTGHLYETQLDGGTRNIHSQVRFKRSLESELFNEKASDEITLEESTTKNMSPTLDPAIEISPSNGNINHPVNNINDKVKTDEENAEVHNSSESASDIRGNFETTVKNSIQTSEASIPSIDSERMVPNIKEIEKIRRDNNKTFQVSNPLKKDVEIIEGGIRANNHKMTKTVITQQFLPLPENSNIPSIIEDTPDQLDHNIKKKNVNYDDVESFTPEYNVPRNVYRHRPRGRNGNQLEIIDEFSPQAGRLKSLTAIHLNGDTSQYTLGIHTNYKGNGHLRHPQKTFLDWKMSDWVETISATNSFHLKSGVVTVEESGLYFIYAQIYYLDEHDSNGFMVRRNSDNILHCKVTAPSSERLMKGNTCYTGAVVYLDTNDRISLDDISDGRYTLFVPGYSFFGMIKIGDIKGK